MNRATITRIKGLSEVRRLPRLGKIRLGVKVKSARTGKEYPKEVPHFVCPQDVQRVYGEKPTLLDIMLPVEDETRCFPQAYKAYVANGLRCKGDGERALRRAADLVWQKDGAVIDDARGRLTENPPMDPNALAEITCPCALLETGACRQSANLMVLLPKVSMGGIWQIDTGSVNNIIRINSAIDYVRCLLGRVALVPLVLTRQEEEIEYEGKKAKHYLLQCTLNANLEEVARLREDMRMILRTVERVALPSPVEDGPEPTGEAPTEESENAAAETADAKIPDAVIPPERQGAEAAPSADPFAHPQTSGPSAAEVHAQAVQEWADALAGAESTKKLQALWKSLSKKNVWPNFTGMEQVRLTMVKDKQKGKLAELAKMGTYKE